jgi:hypothetical protein
VVPKPQKEHDGNHTNTLVQPVHPAKENIFSSHRIHSGHFLVSHNLVKLSSDVSEKCTVSVFRVTEPSAGACRSKWEERMCSLDRKGGGNFGRSKLWKGKGAKILCCPSGSSEFKKG